MNPKCIKTELHMFQPKYKFIHILLPLKSLNLKLLSILLLNSNQVEYTNVIKLSLFPVNIISFSKFLCQQQE